MTGKGVVDMVITDMAVFEFDKSGEMPRMKLIELADGVALEEVKAATEAEFEVAV